MYKRPDHENYIYGQYKCLLRAEIELATAKVSISGVTAAAVPMRRQYMGGLLISLIAALHCGG